MQQQLQRPRQLPSVSLRPQPSCCSASNKHVQEEQEEGQQQQHMDQSGCGGLRLAATA